MQKQDRADNYRDDISFSSQAKMIAECGQKSKERDGRLYFSYRPFVKGCVKPKCLECAD